MIFQQSLEEQYLTLIAHPLRSLLSTGVNEHLTFTSLVIIDGLDECTDSTRHEVVNTILRVGRRFRLPLIFLIASRPEQDISLPMNPTKAGTDVACIALDTEYRSNDDIEQFLRDKISEIRDTHSQGPALSLDWPSHENIRTLVRKSSGQFIYAATSVKFIGSRGHHPARRLDVVIGVIPPSPSDLPFAELVLEYVTVTIFLFHYGLHTPLPRDPTTCMAALTFSLFLCTIMTRPDSFSFSSPTMLDSYGLLVTPTFYQV